jgi:hypothetical protein
MKKSSGKFGSAVHDSYHEEHGTDMSREPKGGGKADNTGGLADYKGEADPIAFGQAAPQGFRSDEKKMSSQFKDYHWN